jgi:hypothetical protein
LKKYKYIYKITYPNEKIYVGSDATGNNLIYFGSPTREYLEKDFEKDFPWEQQQEIVIRKTILDYFENISNKSLRTKENEYIEKLGSNNPDIGYNLKPKFVNKGK